jgi:hypothetical protein
MQSITPAIQTCFISFPRQHCIHNARLRREFHALVNPRFPVWENTRIALHQHSHGTVGMTLCRRARGFTAAWSGRFPRPQNPVTLADGLPENAP